MLLKSVENQFGGGLWSVMKDGKSKSPVSKDKFSRIRETNSSKFRIYNCLNMICALAVADLRQAICREERPGNYATADILHFRRRCCFQGFKSLLFIGVIKP